MMAQDSKECWVLKPGANIARMDFAYNIGPYREKMATLFGSRDLTEKGN